MNASCSTSDRAFALTSNFIRSASVVALFLFVAYAMPAMAEETGVNVSLSGDQEVPPVETSAKGTGTIVVAEDRTVSGSVTTSGVEGIAAHIHLAAPGKNGPPVITLTKTSEYVWTVPAGAKLTDEQYASYQAGNLYVNVHSTAHKSGEIRDQLEPLPAL